MLEWLLAGDVAVQFAARRDLLHRVDPRLQERISEEGYGAALLAARGAGGHGGSGFYQPKWTSSHYTLLELKNLGLVPTNPLARETVTLILDEEKGRDGGLNPSRTIPQSDACVNGMAIGYAAYFGAAQDDLASVVDFLLAQRLPDGGFNCRFNRSGARHSSVHTTVSVIEGITEYERRGYHYRLDELASARATAAEFLLRHHLYRSERTGTPMNAEFTRLHHPARWHFDILRGLDALRDADVPHDPRMDDALSVLRDRRADDGRWVANQAYHGATHVRLTPVGRPDPWVTVIALRVLAAYPSPNGIQRPGARG